MSESPEKARGQFATTQWSIVLAAGGRRTDAADRALAVLTETYWYPLYAYLRRRGHSAADAEDLVQAFFLRLLEKDVLTQANPERGRFRSFLLVALKYFVANAREHTRAQKRGGAVAHHSLDTTAAEKRYTLEPVDIVHPETLFERRWALTLLDRAQERLRREFIKAGKGELFDALKDFVRGDGDDVPYRRLGESIGLSEGAARVTVHRMRKGFRRQLELEIAETVDTPDAVAEELHFLGKTLAAGDHR